MELEVVFVEDSDNCDCNIIDVIQQNPINNSNEILFQISKFLYFYNFLDINFPTSILKS